MRRPEIRFGIRPPWVPYVLLGCLALLILFVVAMIAVNAIMYLRTAG